MYNSGELFERSLSLKIHKIKTPVLVSSKLLREFGCGQIDLAYIDNRQITLIEVKSSQIGLQQMRKSQMKRLMRSARLIESLVGLSVSVKFIAKRLSGI